MHEDRLPSASTPFAEGQGAKVAVYDPQQLLCLGQTQRHMPNIKVLHVMAALQVLMNISLAYGTTNNTGA